MKKDRQSNLLEMTPRRVQEWTVGEDGRVRILVPRYGAHRPGRWLAARMGRKEIMVRLDRTGSLIWQACDGTRNVGQITAAVSAQMADPQDELLERMARYLRELEISRFIAWV